MENTQENLSDNEQINHPSPTDHDNSAENRRYTFIQRQLTPLLAAISIVELPLSEEDENENSDSADENSEMNLAKRATTDTCSEAEMDWTKGATTRDNCMLERMLLLEQKCQNLQKENNKLTRKIKIEQKKERKQKPK